MSTPDVRVRLTAEGVKEIVAALRQVDRQAGRSSRRAAGNVGLVSGAVRELKTLLPALGLGAAVAGFGGLARSALNAADEIGKTAAKIGTTTETLSVLTTAAATADVTQEELVASTGRLARSLQGLQQGLDRPVAAFQRLNLAASDLRGRDTGEAFALIAERLAKLPDGLNKTQIAIELFGSSGAELIPLLNDLGLKGFAIAREEAERFGLVISSDMAAAAEAANAAFTLLGLQARGLATQFALGLAPSIVQAMSTFQDETAGKGAAAMKRFGEATGRTLRAIIGLFRLFGNAIGTVLDVIGADIGALVAAIAQAFRGNFSEAGNILIAAFEDSRQKLHDGFVQLFADFDQLVKDVQSDPPEIPVKVRPEIDASAGAAGADPALARRRQAEADRARREAERARAQQLRREEAAIRALADVERETLEATGRSREAQIAALDEELRRRREILSIAGKLNAANQAALDRLREVRVAEINFDDITAQGERAFGELERARLRIQQDVELGIETELGGQQRILDIERQRLPVLQDLAAAALAAAQATGNPELIANAAAFNQQVEQLGRSVALVGDELTRFVSLGAQAATGALTDFFADGIESADSLGDAFRDLASAIVESLQRIAAEIISQQIITSLLRSFGGGLGAAAGGEVVRAAGGGLIRGPGTPTSDNIPAWLSPGEFVVRARAVAQPGMLDTLHAINNLRAEPALRPRLRFAEGGPVPAAQPASARIEGGVNIGLAPGLVAEEIATPEGTRSLLKVVQKNPRAFRAALGV